MVSPPITDTPTTTGTPTTSDAPGEIQPNEDSLSVGWILLIILGAVLFFGLDVGVTVFVMKKKNK